LDVYSIDLYWKSNGTNDDRSTIGRSISLVRGLKESWLSLGLDTDIVNSGFWLTEK
jgi:hypothetical protein